jgi:hypothetical protein
MQPFTDCDGEILEEATSGAKKSQAIVQTAKGAFAKSHTDMISQWIVSLQSNVPTLKTV